MNGMVFKKRTSNSWKLFTISNLNPPHRSTFRLPPCTRPHPPRATRVVGMEIGQAPTESESKWHWHFLSKFLEPSLRTMTSIGEHVSMNIDMHSFPFPSGSLLRSHKEIHPVFIPNDSGMTILLLSKVKCENKARIRPAIWIYNIDYVDICHSSSRMDTGLARKRKQKTEANATQVAPNRTNMG